MKKKTNKLPIIIFFLVIFVLFIYQVTDASFGVRDLTGTAVSSNEAKIMGNKLITAVSTIGSIISVIILIVIGIKYMLGSTEEKAEYKKAFLPYTIGASLVFSASVIAGIIYNLIVN